MSMTREPSMDEREWQSQERGMRAARGHNVGDGDEADIADLQTAHYRVVAQALRSTPNSQPPTNFASSVARLALTRSDAGFERMLAQILLIVSGFSSLVAGALYGGQWWQSVHQAFGGDSRAWLMAGMGCLAVSWVFHQLRCIRDHDSDATRCN